MAYLQIDTDDTIQYSIQKMNANFKAFSDFASDLNGQIDTSDANVILGAAEVTTSKSNSVSIGSSAKAQNNKSVAIGYNATINKENGISLMNYRILQVTNIPIGKKLVITGGDFPLKIHISIFDSNGEPLSIANGNIIAKNGYDSFTQSFSKQNKNKININGSTSPTLYGTANTANGFEIWLLDTINKKAVSGFTMSAVIEGFNADYRTTTV